MEKIFEKKEFHGDVSFFKGLTIQLGALVVKALTVVGALSVTGNSTLTGNLTVVGGDVIIPAGKKLYFDGGGDTYLWEGTGDIISWYSGSNVQMYNSGWGMFFPNGFHIIAYDFIANNTPDINSALNININRVNVTGVVTDADDFIYLPRLDQVENGHTIIIMCDAGSNFEIRTPNTRNDLINNVNCGVAGNEYLATDEDTITAIARNATDGWVLTSVTKLGAVRTAVIPD